jgi:hypothetical protein
MVYTALFSQSTKKAPGLDRLGVSVIRLGVGTVIDQSLPGQQLDLEGAKRTGGSKRNSHPKA